MRGMRADFEELENDSPVSIEKHHARKRVEDLAAAMADRERWSRERLLELQQSRLRETVQHAVANSPYYRDVIGDVGNSAIDLRQLPVLTKTTLMAEFDRIVTDPRLRLAGAEEHLASERAGEPLFGEYRIVGSGGTTGKRGVVVYDQQAWDVAVASLLHMLTAQKVSQKARVLGIGAPTPLHMTQPPVRRVARPPQRRSAAFSDDAASRNDQVLERLPTRNDDHLPLDHSPARGNAARRPASDRAAAVLLRGRDLDPGCPRPRLGDLGGASVERLWLD